MIWNHSGRPRLSERIRRFFTGHVSDGALQLGVPMGIALARSSGRQVRAGHLRALEVQISVRAVEAARALDLAHPDPPVFGGFDAGQLRPLLRALTANGLVLPPDVGLLQSDNGF